MDRSAHVILTASVLIVLQNETLVRGTFMKDQTVEECLKNVNRRGNYAKVDRVSHRLSWQGNFRKS